MLNGGAGADRLDGGGDYDTVDYSGSDAAVTVNLATGTVSGGHAQGDTIVSIEKASGSDHDDTLIGDHSRNVLRGGAGADRLDGGGGRDYADYSGSDAAVTVNLATGAASGGHAQGDTLANIEALSGSDYNDTLIGDDSNNNFWGGAGDDTMTGGGGGDVFYFILGFMGNDIITDFEPGVDRLAVCASNPDMTPGGKVLSSVPTMFTPSHTGAGDRLSAPLR